MTTTIATTTATMADILGLDLPPLRRRLVKVKTRVRPRLMLVEAGRGPCAPCHCCGRMTSCHMDPTMGSGIRRPWCMWHALGEATWPLRQDPGSATMLPGHDYMTNSPLEHERRRRRLAHIARRRAAADRAAGVGAYALDS